MRWRQLGVLALRCGVTLDTTMRASARVSATYRALSSSSPRACCSAVSRSVAQTGGVFSLARKMKRRGRSASPGQSTSTPMLSGLGR